MQPKTVFEEMKQSDLDLSLEQLVDHVLKDASAQQLDEVRRLIKRDATMLV